MDKKSCTSKEAYKIISTSCEKSVCVCVYSNSCNDVPRVAQGYGPITAHTRCCASVLVVFVVFLHAPAQFCGFDKADATANVQ